METKTHSHLVEIPEELARQIEELVAELGDTDLARYVRVNRDVALRIALARGIEALREEGRSPLE